MQNAVEFLKDIKQRDNVIIVFHNDSDGICSCVMLKKFLEIHAKTEPEHIISQPMPVNATLVQKIKTYSPNKIIFVDLAVDQQIGIVNELKKYADILIIDHHQMTNHLTGVTYYNPLLHNKSIYQSASYLTYKICSRIIDMSDHLWLAIIGIVSDFDTKDSTDLIKAAREKYPDLIEKTDQESLQRSFFAEISNIVNAVKAMKSMSSEQIARIFDKMTEPKDIINSDKATKLMAIYREINQEMDNITKDIEKKCDYHGNVVFFELKSKYNLRSPISTLLSKRHRDKLIVVWQDEKQIKISARNQNKNINAAQVLKKAAGGHNSAGGHEAAAGATIVKKDWSEFKKRLTEISNEVKKNGAETKS